jgi:hypothetical protein
LTDHDELRDELLSLLDDVADASWGWDKATLDEMICELRRRLAVEASRCR